MVNPDKMEKTDKAIGIMQPYFLPYIGYWQLLNAVDEFIVYDNIQFTKKGWIHRNRHLSGGNDKMFSIPLKKDSDYLDICERFPAPQYKKDGIKLMRKLEGAYQKAPFFEETFPLINQCINQEDTIKIENKNLFEVVLYSVKKIADHLEINTKMTISSTIDINHDLKAADRVVDICHHQKATTYINSIGGTHLYDKQSFKEQGLKLCFLKARLIEYKQFNENFIPALSIIDILMFTGKQGAIKMLKEYEIL